jgi:hypothetical protein
MEGTITMKLSTTALVAVIAGGIVLTSATLSSAASRHAQPASQQVVAHTASHVQASRSSQVKLSLTPSSSALAQCFPKAKAKVTVDLTTDARGKDKFRIVASGLKPRTDFTVFLLQQAGSPFGAAEYIGDFTTDRHGRGANTFNLIVEEAFAFNNVTKARTDLNSVGFWVADPKDDDGCLGANSPVTGFDGDGEAGVQMMNSGSALLP